MLKLEATGRAHIGYLDGWRGLSIICVLQGHFISVPWLDLGGFGVLMFYCLSGRLMSYLLFENRQPLSQFYRRRFSRIYPAFLIFVLSMFVLAAHKDHNFSWIELASTLAFTRTYFPAPGIWGTGMPIGHLWSLNVEEHSYLLMSLLTLVMSSRFREGVFLILTGCLCILIGFIYIKLGKLAPFWGSLGSEVAASHILIAAGYRLICDRLRNFVPPWAPLTSLLVSIALTQYSPLWWLPQLLSPFLLAFAVNHLSEATPLLRSILSWRPLRYFGIWSFSIYLWQQPFYANKNMASSSLLLILTMMAALLSFYLIERPTREWLNRNWR